MPLRTEPSGYTEMSVVEFPTNKRKPLPFQDVETIGFLTVNDRDLFISDSESIRKIMSFIVREKITILEEE